MSAHPTHDWSENTWHCYNCACHVLSYEAAMKCVPSTDDAPAEVEPVAAPREIDWFAINRCF